MVASARTIVVGFSGLDAVWDPGVWTFGPRADELTPGGASNKTETAVGWVTWPGMTRANSSSRLCGFCTMPTTVRAWVP